MAFEAAGSIAARARKQRSRNNCPVFLADHHTECDGSFDGVTVFSGALLSDRHVEQLCTGPLGQAMPISRRVRIDPFDRRVLQSLILSDHLWRNHEISQTSGSYGLVCDESTGNSMYDGWTAS